MTSQDEPTFNRRRFIQGVSAAAAAGLAGCNGSNAQNESGDGGGTSDQNGGGSSGDFGEKVPTLVIEMWSDLPNAKATEDAISLIGDDLSKLGIEVKTKPVQFSSQITHNFGDKRTHHLSFWYHESAPSRLDPHEMTRRYAADWAGGDGMPNPANYASCEHTVPAMEQASAGSEEERQKLVTKAQTALSEDIATIPLVNYMNLGAANTAAVSVSNVGKAGINRMNPQFFVNSTPKNGDGYVAYTAPLMLETANYPLIDSSLAVIPWSQLVNSGLVGYDENFELQKILAKDYSIEDDGKKFTFKLRDATFHNGDPVTAEDVKFTYNWLADNPGAFPKAVSPPYKSIEAKDEKTVVFNFEESYLPLISKVLPRWGVLHKKSHIEGGADKDPEGYNPKSVVGSGPFKVTAFEQGQVMKLEPHDGHPKFSPSHNVTFQAYSSEQAAFQAFKQNELQVVSALSPGLMNRLQKEGESVKSATLKGFTPFLLYPQYPMVPTKFLALRKAIAQAINRKKINDTAFYGLSSPVQGTAPITESHPYRSKDDSIWRYKSDTGDVDAAKSILEEAGWGWDGQGNLRYPSDADLSPKWPKGEEPPADEFKCLAADGEGENKVVYAGSG